MQSLTSRNETYERPRPIWTSTSLAQANLVLMTSRGKGGSSRGPSGSVAAKMMQLGSCPVLFVRKDMSVQQSNDAVEEVVQAT